MTPSFIALMCHLAPLPAHAAALGSNASSHSTIKISPKESSEAESNSLFDAPLYVIDAPTGHALEAGDFEVRSRFFSGGGLLEYAYFGVLDRLDVGASLNADGVIGGGPAHVQTPEAELKWEFYQGRHYWPAMAVGYDGQGFDYNPKTQSYNEPRRGAYLAFSQKLGLPELVLHPSVSVSDFNQNAFSGALPLTLTLGHVATLMAEWDQLGPVDESRFNAGIRFHITHGFALDFDTRSIGQGGTFSDGTSRGPERIVQLFYRGELF